MESFLCHFGYYIIKYIKKGKILSLSFFILKKDTVTEKGAICFNGGLFDFIIGKWCIYNCLVLFICNNKHFYHM